MQIVAHKGNIVEKVLRDKEGRLVRAKFYVYESAGRIRARLLEAVIIPELIGNKLSISSPMSDIGVKMSKCLFDTISPYFTKDVLNFLGNKPRAPTN